MDIVQFLEEGREEILQEAHAALQRVQLPGYASAGQAAQRQYLADLLTRLISSIRARDLTAIVQYAEEVAEKRFAANFSLLEVQTGFNVLEEAIWKRIIAQAAPDQLASAIGLVSTVHGAGKDALARRYVTLASKTKSPSLNLSALFKGSTGA